MFFTIIVLPKFIFEPFDQKWLGWNHLSPLNLGLCISLKTIKKTWNIFSNIPNSTKSLLFPTIRKGRSVKFFGAIWLCQVILKKWPLFETGLALCLMLYRCFFTIYCSYFRVIHCISLYPRLPASKAISLPQHPQPQQPQQSLTND